MKGHVAAIDLGATSGRVVLGSLENGCVSMQVVTRFPNGPTGGDGRMRWDVSGLYDHAMQGIASTTESGITLSSLGIDSWAVDYGLLSGGVLLAEPTHYRDPRTLAGVAAVHETIDHSQLYRRNGLQFLPFTTLYQLAADRVGGDLEQPDQLLLIPDLLAFWMTGAVVSEETNASTTGLLPTSSLEWDHWLLDAIDIPASLFAPLVRPGHQIGELTSTETSQGQPIPVTAVGSHDTASAVVAVPMDPATAVYISCGTWGLVGVECGAPIINDEARLANFTNERGVDGTTRFLRNVMGLWLLSECIRDWEGEGMSVDLEALLLAATDSPPPAGLIDVDDPDFMAPGGMTIRIANHLQNRGLPSPSSAAETVRVVLESLAEAFSATARSAALLSGIALERIHVVGGGAQNRLLCQLVADRSGVEVIAGPVEATAFGNVLVQARSVGLVDGDLAALRDVVRSSTELVNYSPST